MAVWYLDSENEITDAVARLRSTSGDQVVFVVPPGSRIATGRINFKLLAREASARDLRMAIASPDAQVRAMASSAGVLALATVSQAEAALARGESAPPEEPEGGDGDGSAVAAGTTAVAAGATAIVPGVGGGTGTATGTVVAGRRRPALGRTGRVVAATTVGVLTIVAIGLVASLQALPTAEITLTPRTVAIGPLAIEIMGRLDITEPDPERWLVPAIELPIPLSVEGAFPATGSQTVQAKARGEVVFSSADQDFDQPISAGTRLQTISGTEFQTTRPVVLPHVADGAGPAQVVAPVEALAPGPDGNVGPDSIIVVPSLQAQGIGVTNPEPTAGGRLERSPVVTRADYDAATADLQNRLAGALAGFLRDPSNLPPGLTAYPETAAPGEPRFDPAPEEVVGTRAPEFRVAAAADASVVAVDPAQVEHMADDALRREVPAGMAVFPETLRIEPGAGVVEDDGVRFVGTASAQAYQVIDEEAVLARVAGKPVSEARAILEDLGATTVSVWPEFLGDLPGDPERIELEVRAPTTE